MSHVYVGTSGWNYRNWREGFYGDTPQAEWLAFCAKRFTGLEVNGTFYRLQSRETFRRWRDETPADFRFTIKANRYLTHSKRLKDPVDSLRRERERADAMAPKLAVVLWQLPNGFQKNIERLEAFAEALDEWDSVRHAIEFRHRSWFDDQVADCLSRHRLANCQSDAADWPLWEAVTTDLVYIRLHGHTRTYASAYSSELLERWAERITHWLDEGRQVHAYFDNDSEGAAPLDALKLLDRLPTD